MRSSKCPPRDILVSLYTEHTDKEIGVMYEVDQTTVRYWRKNYNIPAMHMNGSPSRHHLTDETFFDSIDTPDKAYIIGLILADGSISKSLRTVSLALKDSDRHLIEDVRNAMGSEAKIGRKQALSGYNPDCVLAVVTFSRKRLIKALLDLGITPNKSSNTSLHLPSVQPEFQADLIRGYFDGNGWITDRQFGFVGHRTLLQDIKTTVFNHTGKELSITGDANLSMIRLVGGRKTSSVLIWIYKGANLKLQRKFQMYTTHWV